MLSNHSRIELVSIAREALLCAVRGEEYTLPPQETDELSATCGCFVTYKTDGRLRGCLGCFTSTDPLYETVAKYARLSATSDPRFAGNRLTETELEKVDLDISVLSPLEPCAEPEKIVPGKHGIYIRSGSRSGCFLPQVATETGWSVEQFWSNCCSHKAGLSEDAWRHQGVDLFIFTADVIESVKGEG